MTDLTPIIAQVGEPPDRIRQSAAHGPYRVVKSRGDAALALARELIEAKYDPIRPYEVWRGEMRCLTYPSLGVAAGLTVEERDDGSRPPRFVKWRALPQNRVTRDQAVRELTAMDDDFWESYRRIRPEETDEDIAALSRRRHRPVKQPAEPTEPAEPPARDEVAQTLKQRAG